MKKLLLIACILATFGTQSFAQLGLPKLPAKITDIAGSTTKISDKISTEVGGITKPEEKSLKDATSGFLGDYNNLLPKMKTDPTGFTAALNQLKSGYDGKLKTILGATKFAKFAGNATGAAASKVLGMLM